MKEVKTANYVKLQLLQTLWADNAKWQANVLNNVGKKGYTVATDSDDGDAIEARYAVRDMVRVNNVEVYDFAGSAYEQERFYIKDIVVFKHKSTGEYWVINCDDVWKF